MRVHYGLLRRRLMISCLSNDPELVPPAEQSGVIRKRMLVNQVQPHALTGRQAVTRAHADEVVAPDVVRMRRPHPHA